MKITAHETFKNKFDQIRAGIIFIYRQNTSVIGYSVFRQTNKNISPLITTCSFDLRPCFETENFLSPLDFGKIL